MTKQKPVLFSKKGCAPCNMMKLWLKKLNVDYEEVDALNPDGTFNQRFKQFANPHNLMTVPVLASGPDTFTTLPTKEAIERVTG